MPCHGIVKGRPRSLSFHAVGCILFTRGYVSKLAKKSSSKKVCEVTYSTKEQGMNLLFEEQHADLHGRCGVGGNAFFES